MPVEPGGTGAVAGIELPEGDPGAVLEVADGLRRAGHAFGASAHTIGRAMSAVPSWAGLAAFSYHDLCRTQQGTAQQSGGAAQDAAHAVAQYGHALAEARRQISQLQQEAAHQDAIRITAESDAQLATSRAETAYRTAHVVGMDPSPGSQAAADDLRRQGQRAADESTAHAQTAARAKQALDDLRLRATGIQRGLAIEAAATTTRVRACTASLPAVTWPGQGSQGDTVTNSWSYSDEAAVTAFFIKLQNGQEAILEKHAGGYWTVEVGDSLGAGLSGTLGEKVEVGSEGGASKGVSRDLQGSIMAQGGHGMTFRFDSRDEAMDFLGDAENPLDDGWTTAARLAGGPIVSWIMGAESPDDDRDPIERYVEGGIDLKGSARIDGGGLTAGADAELDTALGTREDVASGDQTAYYSTKASAGASLEVLSMGASGSLEGSSVTAVTRNPQHEITKFSITSSTATSGSVDFKPDLKDLADLGKQVESAGLSTSTGSGTRTETTVTLDVTPGDQALVQHYLDSGGQDPAVTHKLLDRLNHAGQLDVRVYDTQTSSTGVDVSAEGFGAEGSHVETVSVLRDAWVRPPGDTMLHHLRVHG